MYAYALAKQERSIMRFLVSTVLVSLLGFGAAPKAQADPVLVELFTSQGCHSCPPADDFLGALGERDDVVALAYHVDYWDYLGWKDTFAQNAFTQRQRQYAPRVDRSYIGRSFGGIFTPEMVVHGSDSLIGSTRTAVLNRIKAHEERAPVASISVTRDGGRLVISVTPAAGGAPEAQVMLARFTPTARVDVQRGENAGKSLTYHNVVTELGALTNWDGASSIAVEAPDDGGAAAVFLQRGTAGPVLAATVLK